MFVEKPFPFFLQSVVSFLTVISHLCFLHQIIDVTLMGIFETDKKTVKSTSIRVKTKKHRFSFNFLQTIVNNLKIYINKGVIRHLIERNATA